MITKNYIAKGEGANRFEKVPVRIYEKPSEAVKAVAREIADLIRNFPGYRSDPYECGQKRKMCPRISDRFISDQTL